MSDITNSYFWGQEQKNLRREILSYFFFGDQLYWKDADGFLHKVCNFFDQLIFASFIYILWVGESFRLLFVDCPEANQCIALGEEILAWLNSKTSKIVEVSEAPGLCKRSSRRLADLWTFDSLDDVYYNNGFFFNFELVKKGYAFLYKLRGRKSKYENPEPKLYLRLLFTKTLLEERGIFSAKWRGFLTETPGVYKEALNHD